MSLESAITENTAAVLALTAALISRADPKVTNASAGPQKSAKKNPNPKSKATESDVSQAEEDCQDLYQKAATAITTLSREKGREAALMVLANFGASKLPEVPLDRLQEVIAATNQALGASE
jgi:hypothetical protein